MLNKRQERIIMLLSDNSIWKTGRQLSVILNVSDRTIRSDIEKINNSNHKICIKSDLKKGYCLDNTLPTRVGVPIQRIPQTPYQRRVFIINRLLVKEWNVNIHTLIDQIYVSDISFNNDLKNIMKILKSYPTLNLIKNGNMICLIGNETMKRKIYKDILLKELTKNFLNLDELADSFNEFDVLVVKEILGTILLNYNYQVKEMEIPSLLLDIGICMQRMMSQNYISISIKNEALLQSVEYAIANAFFIIIAKRFFLKVTKEEIASFAVQLYRSKCEDKIKNCLALKDTRDTIYILVNKILQDMYVIFTIDFREDKKLMDGLFFYIHALMKRGKDNQISFNIYVEDIKRKYPYVFEIAIHVSKLIKKETDIHLYEDDVGFLAQYIGGAMEENEFEDKYNILMIYPSDQTFSKLYMEKIKCFFSNRISDIECLNYYEEKKILEIHPDLILTTLPLEHALDIVTVQISIFMNAEEERKIENALYMLNQKNIKTNFAENIKKMIEPRFFYADKEISTPEEIIHFISEELYHYDIVEATFEEAVIERENFSSTSLVYSIAVPHPIFDTCKQSKIAVMLLKKPMQWGEYPVKIIFLLAIHEDDQKFLKVFFDWLNYVISDFDWLINLMNCKDYKTFIDVLLKKEY